MEGEHAKSIFPSCTSRWPKQSVERRKATFCRFWTDAHRGKHHINTHTQITKQRNESLGLSKYILSRFQMNSTIQVETNVGETDEEQNRGRGDDVMEQDFRTSGSSSTTRNALPDITATAHRAGPHKRPRESYAKSTASPEQHNQTGQASKANSWKRRRGERKEGRIHRPASSSDESSSRVSSNAGSEGKQSDSLSGNNMVTESTRNSSEDDINETIQLGAPSNSVSDRLPYTSEPGCPSPRTQKRGNNSASSKTVRHSERKGELSVHSSGSEFSTSGPESISECLKRAPLVVPHREPAFDTIKHTFQRVSSSKRHAEYGTNQMKRISKSAKVPRKNSDEDYCPGANGSSSGSGTEAGYAASASSNDKALKHHNDTTRSESSSEQSTIHHKSTTVQKVAAKGHRLLEKEESSVSMSSELADFSSGNSRNALLEAFKDMSESDSITSSSNGSSDEVESPRKDVAKLSSIARLPKRSNRQTFKKRNVSTIFKSDKSHEGPLIDGKPPVMSLGCDVMAHVLTFLEPPEILDVLTTPFSKGWVNTFTRQPELWRVLCYLPPFKAQVEDGSDDSSVDSSEENVSARDVFGRYRLIYTSFVKCMRYLTRIKEDAVNGRAPSSTDSGLSAIAEQKIGSNRKLRHFLARTRGFAERKVVRPSKDDFSSNSSGDDDSSGGRAIETSDDGGACPPVESGHARSIELKKRPRFGHSKLTQRLLGPTQDGSAGDVNLPWSCAIYSIVNWMIAFSDAEGIQVMSLKVLPFLLEDERQRTTAQRAGLTEVVLRAMVMFSDSDDLHTQAFHTLVLLARPLGGKLSLCAFSQFLLWIKRTRISIYFLHCLGREGMLFHSSMVNTAGIFNNLDGSQDHKNGIAVMLDSMKRFAAVPSLQAMSCWSLVNISLVPVQKEVLVRLGGLQAAANAMTMHPDNAEVQFRALFALINLVIPTPRNPNATSLSRNDSSCDEPSERDMLDEMVVPLVDLVVRCMKTFCSSGAILNRACLVLHNLSLAQEYHRHLLMAPYCYQMLEWCVGNYRTDQILQQSAAGTLHRLQSTLSSDPQLEALFSASLRSQQRRALEMALHEAVELNERQRRQQSASSREG